jgi:hypothetical protein
LLEKYGGIWADSTLFINTDLSEKYDNNYDVAGFYANFMTIISHKPVMENWFISAPKGSPLIKEWKKEFFKGLKNPDDYIENGIHENGIVDLQKIDNKIYLMMHCCFLKVINDDDYSIKLDPAFTDMDSPFGYQEQSNWIAPLAIKSLCENEVVSVPPILKFRGGERGVFEIQKFYHHLFNIIYGITDPPINNINPQSVMGRMLYN